MADDVTAQQGSKVSRRSLLAAAGAVTGGTVLARMPRAARAAGRSFDAEADVIVVGGGGAAFAAAIGAAQSGTRVLVLEKAPAIGGTTARSGGAYWIPDNHLMRAKGVKDPKDDAVKLMARLAFPSVYDPEAPYAGLDRFSHGALSAYFDLAPQVVERIERAGVLRSQIAALRPGQIATGGVDWTHPEYHAELPENKAPYGRTLHPVDAEGGGGGSLMSGLATFARKQGVRVLTGQHVVQIATNEKGEVVGVQAQTPQGERLYRARKAVVFGSGGFTQDRSKVMNYLRGPIFGGCAVPTNTGDFIDMASQLGARLGNMRNAFLVQHVLEQALANSSVVDDLWIPPGDSMIMVNRFGDRVASEKTPYHEHTQSHFVWDTTRSEYPNLVQFMVYDSGVANDPYQAYGMPYPRPGTRAPYVIEGATIPELARNVERRLDKLRGRVSINGAIGPDVRLSDGFADNVQRTIDRFNGFAREGHDADFGRGSTPIQVSWGGPRRRGNDKNPSMYPISGSGPYYCILIGGGTLDTNGGPVVDASGRVLHVSGRPIPGLYGAGNCVASLAGQAYWSAGGTLGPAITNGFTAGENAIGEPVKEV
ncbi:FAD-dependent oxidoreductase [Conexibacter woesei]|uniref:Fumarate reductase/succinate dehydrogenase flavoprotein domain protein n=1 Tax=Conexibacter woesei (strain DSM 14684 / CCUG 47730 / CIP 108061 / JCM 11494 / NBRC 100937 / ID131577) TaxID=469383 RepID=D3EZW3_CONWI|nr:FAD-dependent oxidoreductase [Conexibacter woesei]ADB49939.1 fumarate reductase/succinate dehydrogenase flavoprotein domain protein [Conexibacter woesei DSM 14684]